jgi:hypothetical protein
VWELDLADFNPEINRLDSNAGKIKLGIVTLHEIGTLTIADFRGSLFFNYIFLLYSVNETLTKSKPVDS